MIELLLLNSLIILGIFSNSGTTPEGNQAFYWLHSIRAPWWVKKPLIECMSCMASIHSIYVYWPYILLCGDVKLISLLVYPLYVVALAGLNYLLYRIANIGSTN